AIMRCMTTGLVMPSLRASAPPHPSSRTGTPVKNPARRLARASASATLQAKLAACGWLTSTSATAGSLSLDGFKLEVKPPAADEITEVTLVEGRLPVGPLLQARDVVPGRLDHQEPVAHAE